MTTTPQPAIIVTTGAGEALSSAFQKDVANAQAFYGWGLTVDSALASVLAQIIILQKNVLPVGAYQPPTNANAFIYSGNANVWSGLTLQKQSLNGAPIVYPSPDPTTPPVWSYPMNTGNTTGSNTVIQFWVEGVQTNVLNLRAQVVSIDQSGNITLSNPVTVDSVTGGTYQANSWGIVSCVANGSLSVKLSYQYNMRYTNSSPGFVQQKIANIAYDGASTLTPTVSNVGGAVANNVGTNTLAYNVNTQGYVVGSASVAFVRRYDNIGAGAILYDGSFQTTNNVTSVQDVAVKSAYVQDTIGNSTIVEAYTGVSTQDTTARLIVRVSQFSDAERTILSTARVPGYAVGSIQSVFCFGPGLVAVWFTDTGPNKRVALLTISPAGALGLVGVYNSGFFNTVTPIFGATFSALTLVGVAAGSATNQYVLYPITYNPNASQPGSNDFTSTTSFTYTFGNMASAIQSTLRSVIRLNANQLLLSGYGGTSSTKSVINETVSAS